MRALILILLATFTAANGQGIFARKKLPANGSKPPEESQVGVAVARTQIVRLPVPGNVLPELRNDDALRMKLDGVDPAYAGEYQFDVVVSDGGIVVPMLGRVAARGLTPAQVAAGIEREMIAQKLFTAPRVSLERIGWVPFVTIRGDVRAPGRVYWTPGLTLLAVHAAVGGPSGWGTPISSRLLATAKRRTTRARASGRIRRRTRKLLPATKSRLRENIDWHSQLNELLRSRLKSRTIAP